MWKIIKGDLNVRYSSAFRKSILVMNIANFVDPHFKEDYLSQDELILVKEKIAVDIDVKDGMDHNYQEDRNKEEQLHQKDADIMSCEEQQELSDECGYTELRTYKKIKE